MNLLFKVLPIFLCINLFSQVIDYDYKNNGTTLKYQLLVSNNQQNSEWRMIVNGRGDSISIENNFRPFYKKENEYYLEDKTINGITLIKYVPSIKWNSQKDNKVILGYKCNSSITEFRGRTYKAYYTASIKYNLGPWKFSEINGLILSIISEDGLYAFEATKVDLNINKFNEDRLNTFINNNSFIDWNNFVKMYKNDIDKFILNEKCNCETDGTNVLQISKIEKVYPELHDNGITY